MVEDLLLLRRSMMAFARDVDCVRRCGTSRERIVWLSERTEEMICWATRWEVGALGAVGLEKGKA